MAELKEISAQIAADVVARPSPSPSTLALSVAASSAPAVEQSLPHSLLPSASAAAGERLCSAGSRQL